MKNIGKISLAAGLAAAAFILLRKRKDGTRMLDDLTHQVSKWTTMLMDAKDDFIQSKAQTQNKSVPRTAPRTTTASVAGRNPGDIQE
ncbi:MAG: hypothetical protein ACKOW2_01975 [Sphingobacteriaceae bacterium]